MSLGVHFESFPRFSSLGKNISLVSSLLIGTAALGSAGQLGNLFYTDSSSTTTTIYDCLTSASGHVEIPQKIGNRTVTAIGYQAFANCTKITSVTFPEGVTGIGEQAFMNCSALTSVSLPTTLTGISQWAFEKCGALTDINLPEGLTTLGGVAFQYCTSLPSITIPASTTTIGIIPFSACTSLASVTVHPDNPNYSSMDGVFYNKDQTILLQCPAGKEGALVIPSTVTSIPSFGVSRAHRLTSVTMPDSVTSLGQGAFQYCSSLVDVVLSNNLATLPSSTFFECTALESVALPTALTEIGVFAFLNCSSLDGIALSSSVTTIGGAAFGGCSALRDFSVDPANPNYFISGGLLFDTAQTRIMWCRSDISGKYVVPATVTTIEGSAFKRCTELAAVEIHPNVTQVGSSSFAFCDALADVTVPAVVVQYTSPFGDAIWSSVFEGCTGIRRVSVMPGGTGLSIRASALAGWTNIQSVHFGLGVTSIEATAFNHCTALERATFDGDAPVLGANAFRNAAPNFAIYHFNGAAGFTSPTWNGYPAVNMGSPTPESQWLVENHQPHDAGLESDPNQDGVSLLMAYALKLDPRQNLSDRLPKPVISANEMSMKFHAGTPGVTYEVQTSTDMVEWNDTGLLVSEADAEQNRTATVDRDEPARFMRLKVRMLPP
jgi:hypothetical protein